MRRSLRRTSKMLLIPGAVLLLLAGLLLLSVGCMDCLMPGFENGDRAKLDMQNIAGALKLYFHKTGRLPSTHEGLQPLVDASILEAIPVDPWGNRYRYTLHEDGVELVSWGSDGAPGGSGNEADIFERVLRTSAALPDAGT